MASLNRCEFIGNVGRAPEGRQLPSGDTVCSFSIAVNENWTDKTTGERKERVTWVPVNVFGKLAEICSQYLGTGSQVYISGKFTVRKWQDKDGKDVYSTEIVAEQMQMLGGRSGGESAAQRGSERAPTQGRQQAPQNGFEDMDDDIPF